MPYKDPERKRAHMKEWRDRKMGAGYGKWLYAKRRLIYEDRERFKETLEMISERVPPGSLQEVTGNLARDVLEESRAKHESLGRFDEGKGTDFPASVKNIQRWLTRAEEEGAKWLVIKTDKDDFVDNAATQRDSLVDDACYPVQARTPEEAFKAIDNGDETVEVYDMSRNIEMQLREHRANHPPERPS